MLRLFKIVNARNKTPITENGKVVYFNDKQKAKAKKRSLLHEKKHLIVVAGPDHKKTTGFKK